MLAAESAASAGSTSPAANPRAVHEKRWLPRLLPKHPRRPLADFVLPQPYSRLSP